MIWKNIIFNHRRIKLFMNPVFQKSITSKVHESAPDKSEQETGRKRSCLPGPLTPGKRLLFRFLVSCALSTREQMYSFVRVLVRSTLTYFGFQSAQDLMSLMATMIAMMTMRMTRTMSR